MDERKGAHLIVKAREKSFKCSGDASERECNSFSWYQDDQDGVSLSSMPQGAMRLNLTLGSTH